MNLSIKTVTKSTAKVLVDTDWKKDSTDLNCTIRRI